MVNINKSKYDALTRFLLILIAFSFVFIFLILPLYIVFKESLSEGLKIYFSSISNYESYYAIKLTFLIAVIVIPLNIIFGLCSAWAIAKFNFPGKSVLSTIIELPFSISPVIVGLIFSLSLGKKSAIGSFFESHGIRIIFGLPGMIIVTLFVTFPLISRILVPLLQKQGNDEEEAAISMGATGFQTFRYITLPKIKWGLIYGIILSNSRAIGEFGAVSVVSGHITGLTNTVTLQVETLYNDYNLVSAFALSSILTIIAIFIIIIKQYVESKINLKNYDHIR